SGWQTIFNLEKQAITSKLINATRSSGRYEEAESLYLKCINLCQKMARDGTRRIDALDQLGITALNLGNLMMVQKRYEEAQSPYQRAAETFNELERDFPRVVRYQERAARALMGLGLVQRNSDKPVSAEKSYRQAIAKFEAMDRAHGLTPASIDVLAACYNNLGNVHVDAENIEEGLVAFQRAITLRQRLTEVPYPMPTARYGLHRAQGNYANAYQKLHDWDRAHELLVAVFEDQRALVQDHPGNRSFESHALWLFARIADGLRATSRGEELPPFADELTQLLPQRPDAPAQVAYHLALTAGDLDDPETEAERELKDQLAQRAIAGLEAALQLGWQPEDPLAEEDAFQVLQQYDEFHALID
ncbi:MAG: tetratricopeptide repeat protein, partial [Planctomycetota bacterium]